jgi:hypothetical protein
MMSAKYARRNVLARRTGRGPAGKKTVMILVTLFLGSILPLLEPLIGPEGSRP